MTDKLKKLYYEYEKCHGVTPDCYVELEYGDGYYEYVKDIKKALKKGVELPDLYPYEDNWEPMVLTPEQEESKRKVWEAYNEFRVREGMPPIDWE